MSGAPGSGPEARRPRVGPGPSIGPVGLTAYGCEPDEADRFRQLSRRLGVATTIVGDPASAATAAAAAGNRCVSVGHRSRISGRELRALRAVGVEHLSTRSVGLDHIDLGAAATLGLSVEAVAYEPDGVADFTVMLILMAIRGAKHTVTAAAQDDFRLGARGRDLRDLTVGVVGVGRIGSAVIRRLHGFGCRLLACTRSPAAGLGPAALVPLDELLQESDVVTLHLPLDRGTRHLVGRDQLARMKRGAVLVNTGRGALVDTAALVAALDSGRLGGAALDVLEGEEGVFYLDRTDRRTDHGPLWRLQAMSNVIVTPHTAFHTERALQDTVHRTLLRCLTFERDHPHATSTTEDRDPVRRQLRGA